MLKIILPLLLFNFLALNYLLSPIPLLPPLPFSTRSLEPGDTIQIPNVTGYYTNLTRTEVINFYRANYNGLFRIRLNHPPEKSKEIIKDTIQSYYLEEFVLPFKESLYINGFEWENDVFTKPDKRIKNKLIYEGKEYKAKITIRSFPVPVSTRLIVFFLIEVLFLADVFLYYRLFFNRHVRR